MKALVQVRGDVNMNQDVVDTLEMLNLHAVNHCTLVPETDTYQGMITKVNEFVAHGEPSADVLETLIRRRGSPAEGEGDVDDEWVAEHTDYDDVGSLAAALLDDETKLQDQELDPVFRLHPPRGGHDGIKKSPKEGGEIGPHSTDGIDELLVAMR